MIVEGEGRGILAALAEANGWSTGRLRFELRRWRALALPSANRERIAAWRSRYEELAAGRVDLRPSFEDPIFDQGAVAPKRGPACPAAEKGRQAFPLKVRASKLKLVSKKENA